MRILVITGILPPVGPSKRLGIYVIGSTQTRILAIISLAWRHRIPQYTQQLPAFSFSYHSILVKHSRRQDCIAFLGLQSHSANFVF